jgi:hypothetical protein
VTHVDESAAIALRSVRPDDRAFLLSVYASTREPELATVDWDAAQKTAFVRMQFDAQYEYYQEHYDGAAFDVILVGAQPAGRLYVARWTDEIHTVRRRAAAGVLQSPDRHAAAAGTAVGSRAGGPAPPSRLALPPSPRLQRTRRRAGCCALTSRFNPALRLYELLAFRQIDDRASICSWSGEPTNPKLQAPNPNESRSNHLGESRPNAAKFQSPAWQVPRG